MVDVAPFRALRYDPGIAGDAASTSAPAYDDLERFTYAHHRTASPYTVLELLRPQDGYAAAAATYQRWRRTGVLVCDPQPALYRYEEHELRGGRPVVQSGLLVAVAVNDDAVVTHEDVDADRVAQRRARLQAVPVDVAPIFTLAAALPAPVRTLLTSPPSAAPVVALSDETGVDHRVWRLADPQLHALVRNALADVAVLVADGHHRWAAARALHRHAPDWPGTARTLCYLVDAATHGPRLRAVHRLVTHLPSDVRQGLARDFTFVPAPADAGALAELLAREPDGALGLVLPDAALLLRPRDLPALRARLPAGMSPGWRSLDTALLDHVVLPALGVQREQVKPRADLPAAGAEVGADASALFVLRAPSLATVTDLALAGEPLPAKTTSFHPKPRTGLILRPLDP